MVTRTERAQLIIDRANKGQIEDEHLVRVAQTVLAMKAAVAADAPDAALRRQHERKFQSALEDYFAGFLRRLKRAI